MCTRGQFKDAKTSEFGEICDLHIEPIQLHCRPRTNVGIVAWKWCFQSPHLNFPHHAVLEYCKCVYAYVCMYMCVYVNVYALCVFCTRVWVCESVSVYVCTHSIQVETGRGAREPFAASHCLARSTAFAAAALASPAPAPPSFWISKKKCLISFWSRTLSCCFQVCVRLNKSEWYYFYVSREVEWEGKL